MLYMLPALVISIAIHEFCHAYVAYKLGDKSQKYYGRLTLDPFAHIDIFGLISFALVHIGWGKPVTVDDTNFKNKTRDNMLVSLAGPLSNLILAFLLTFVIKILLLTGIFSIADGQVVGSNAVLDIFANILDLSVIYNVTFSVFNMLPFPPFDGGEVLKYFLPSKIKPYLQKLEQYSFIIVIVLLVTNIGVYIISPFINVIYKVLIWILNL